MNLTDEYKLSVYTEEKLIKETDLCRVALVRSSVDGKKHIKKEYADNKSDVYSVLQTIRRTGGYGGQGAILLRLGKVWQRPDKNTQCQRL